MDAEQINPDDRRTQQVDNAIRAIQQKKPVPEIDFTIHTMEDGTQVNTMERVCKGTSGIGPAQCPGLRTSHHQPHLLRSKRLTTPMRATLFSS